MRAHLPKDQPRSRARAAPLVSAADGVDIHAAEAAMLNDIGLYRQPNRRPHLVTVEALLKEHQKKDERSSSSSVSETELLASMAARLSSLERISNQQAQIMREKDENVRSLTAQLVILQQHAHDGEAVAHLEEENMRLKRQIHEMETFLNDYGLVWAGFRADQQDDELVSLEGTTVTSSSSTSDTKVADDSTVAAAAAATKSEIYFDIKQALLSLKDLNQLAGEGHMKIVAERGVAKFQIPEAVPLAFYKNGIFFKNGPLRPYSMIECQAFVKDILEGYFPYELKSTYPDGIVFAVTDRSTEIHSATTAAPTKFQAFGGAGNRLAGTVPSNVPSLSTEQFLNKLPPAVVANGKVIEVRSDIGRLLNAGDRVTPGAANAYVLVRTPIIEQMQRTDGRPSTPGDVATLRVHADDGAPPLLIKLRFYDTIGTLRSFIDNERRGGLNSSSKGVTGLSLTYDLRTNFPSRIYSNDTQTLQETGLVPNATLLLRSKQSPIGAATPSIPTRKQ